MRVVRAKLKDKNYASWIEDPEIVCRIPYEARLGIFLNTISNTDIQARITVASRS